MSDRSIYHVELLYEGEPPLAAPELRPALAASSPGADVHQQDGGGWHVFHTAHPVSFSDGSAPAQTLLAPTDAALDPAALAPLLQQTWDWAEAEATLARCRHQAMLTDLLARTLDPLPRLQLFTAVLEAVVRSTRPLAIAWHPAGKLVAPEAFLAACEDPVQRARQGLNVRLFNIQQRQPGETLMDVVGLAPLGLPDPQLHFVDLEPGRVAGLLYGLAGYLLEKGDVIEDGHTIEAFAPEPDASTRWRCQHEKALVAPERMVLDIDPGPPWAGGQQPRKLV